MRFQIDNMTCGHCARTITRAVQALAPAATVQIDLPGRTVDIEGPLSAARIVDVLAGEGYAAVPIGTSAGDAR